MEMAAKEDNEGGKRFQPLCALEEVEQGTMHEEAKLNRDEKEINLIEDGGILRVGSEQTVAELSKLGLLAVSTLSVKNAELPTACVSSMGKRLAVCQLNQMTDNVEQSGDIKPDVDDFWLNWMLPCDVFGLHKLQFKLKRLKAHLKWWNTDVLGNIHDKVKQAEEEFSIAQKSFDLDPNKVNKLNMAKKQASLFQTLYMEETFWKQKAAVRWMGEGDRNTKFFHSMVQKRRMANRIFRIWNEGICLDKPELIQASGADFFKDLSTGEEFDCTEIDMEHIPSLISANDNSVLCALPSVEIKQIIFDVVTAFEFSDSVIDLIRRCVDASKFLGIHAEIKSINIVTKVKWQKPEVGVYKLNTDGYSKGNPGPSYGFIVRDSNELVIRVMQASIGLGTTVRAELFAIWKAWRHILVRSLLVVILEIQVLKEVAETSLGSTIDRNGDSVLIESQRLFRLGKELLVPNDAIQTMERTRSFEKPIDLLQMHADLFKEGKSAKMSFEINDYLGSGGK
ncbi:hypothetical protein ZIOFF_055632 [Zingiber officinale]|uniref:RNase H type-1 domain-containing protein n=1 Tax=Zingiber officinale TaxID=94328 RepID=A0A8J5FGS9_ZINOF|nr:hypothetical protein ZIOFF_055632 [Zingiber officinale]